MITSKIENLPVYVCTIVPVVLIMVVAKGNIETVAVAVD
jgi:hypothetical protein